MDNNSFSTKPVESSTNNIESTSQPNKLHSRMRPAIAGAIGAITGLTVGAVGIFGLIKLTNKPPKCLECNCERQAATGEGGTGAYGRGRQTEGRDSREV